ncbi:MAG: nickel pincer cofactor biosynthesis protein LarB [Deltaproteobacteria bacterium]|nr:nickel pincer cofactor biosynthesis protein LarB [Deltaproteobacteria bacterium]
MDKDRLKRLLEDLSNGIVSVEKVMADLKDLPFEDLGFACIDHHRGLRRGLSEVIFGEGKEPDDILMIMESMVKRKERILITRLSQDKANIILNKYPGAVYHKRSRMLILDSMPLEPSGKGTIMVMSAGTSDIPVAEEAALTARFMGNHVETIYDVGVSGIHRVLSHREDLNRASVIIVVAGMEGALPSVVGGLVDRPVIAVPTSVGYGASFGGITALLGMLNSCAAGVTVVNIDNGFGAGYAASVINRQ